MVPTGADGELLAALPLELAEEFGDWVPCEADGDWEVWEEDVAVPEGDDEADDDVGVVVGAACDYERGFIHR